MDFLDVLSPQLEKPFNPGKHNLISNADKSKVSFSSFFNTAINRRNDIKHAVKENVGSEEKLSSISKEDILIAKEELKMKKDTIISSNVDDYNLAKEEKKKDIKENMDYDSIIALMDEILLYLERLKCSQKTEILESIFDVVENDYDGLTVMKDILNEVEALLQGNYQTKEVEEILYKILDFAEYDNKVKQHGGEDEALVKEKIMEIKKSLAGVEISKPQKGKSSMEVKEALRDPDNTNPSIKKTSRSMDLPAEAEKDLTNKKDPDNIGIGTEKESNVKISETEHVVESFIIQSKDTDINAVKTQNVESAVKGENVEKNDLIEQVVQKIKYISRKDFSEIKIHLRPESLGKVVLRVIMDKEHVTAKLTTENNQVKEILESNLIELKNSLNEKGISVQSLSVSIGNNESWQNSNRNHQRKPLKQFNSKKWDSKDIDFNLDIINPYSMEEAVLDIKV